MNTEQLRQNIEQMIAASKECANMQKNCIISVIDRNRSEVYFVPILQTSETISSDNLVKIALDGSILLGNEEDLPCDYQEHLSFYRQNPNTDFCVHTLAENLLHFSQQNGELDFLYCGTFSVERIHLIVSENDTFAPPPR